MVNRGWVSLALTALTVAACSGRSPVASYVANLAPVSPPSSTPPSVGPVVAPPAEPTFWEPNGNSTYTPRWTENSAHLHVDGPEIFPAMEALLGRATRLIQIDYYIFSGKQAARIAEILKAKAKAGVTVEVMFDPHLGILPDLKNASAPILKDLVANGIKVKLYPLEQLSSQVGKDTIVDHSKVIVVDGRESMVGGMNLADPFLANHDLMVEMDGPVSQDLGQNLRHDYKKGDGFGTKAYWPPAPRVRAYGESARIRVNTNGLNRRFGKEAVLNAIESARRTCYVLMFQLTHADVIQALIAAKDRGVDVKVILDPGVHDDMVPIIKKAPKGFPNLPAALELKEAGVRVHWYKLKPDMDHMHAKAAVMDGTLAFVGSTNWTYNGFGNNNETSVEILGGSVPDRLHRIFLQDWETQSEEVTDDTKALSGLKAWIVRHTYFP